MIDQCGCVQTPDKIQVIVSINVLMVEDLACGVDLWDKASNICRVS